MSNSLKENVVGVLMGGCSSEREISLKSGEAVMQALQQEGCFVKAVDITSENNEDIIQKLKSANLDIAFIALHGRLGEDGRIQKILESISLPYTGSGVEASQRALDKAITYQCLKNKNITIAPYIVFKKTEKEHILPSTLKDQAVVVKPACEGSSIGISIVKDHTRLEEAIGQAFKYDQKILVEKYIPGKELTVGILKNKLLPVIEICPQRNFFDFTAKYKAGLTDYLVPAPIDTRLVEKVQKIALEVHRALGCRHFSRVDMLLGKDNKIYVLEINTIPGLTATSLFPKAAKAAGITFTELCLYLIRLAYGTQN